MAAQGRNNRLTTLFGRTAVGPANVWRDGRQHVQPLGSRWRRQDRLWRGSFLGVNGEQAVTDVDELGAVSTGLNGGEVACRDLEFQLLDVAALDWNPAACNATKAPVQLNVRVLCMMTRPHWLGLKTDAVQCMGIGGCDQGAPT